MAPSRPTALSTLRTALTFTSVWSMILPGLLLGAGLAAADAAEPETVRVVAVYASFASVPADFAFEGIDLVPTYRFSAIPAVTLVGPSTSVEVLWQDPSLREVVSDRAIDYHLQTAVKAVNAYDVWGSAWHPDGPAPMTVDGVTIDGRGVTVGIVDSGANALHPDLWYAPAAVPGVTPPAKIKACVNIPSALGLVENTPADSVSQPYCDAFTGHGTHVAGIVAGTGFAADAGLAPVLPAGKRQLNGAAPGAQLAVAGLGVQTIARGGLVIDALGGLDWMYNHAEDYDISVLTNSWSTAGHCGAQWNNAGADQIFLDITNKLVLDRGVTVLWAAGNAGDGGALGTSPQGGNVLPGVIMVANYDDAQNGGRDGAINPGSSDGCVKSGGASEDKVWTWPDVAAPGTAIMSTAASTDGAIGQTPIFVGADPTGAPYYTSLTGTSMATPLVAGIVALMRQANPDLTPAQIEKILVETATPWADAVGVRGVGGTTPYWGPSSVNNAVAGFADPSQCRVTPADAAMAEAGDTSVNAKLPSFTDIAAPRTVLGKTVDVDASLFVCRDFKRGRGLVDAQAAVTEALRLANEGGGPGGAPELSIASPAEGAQVPAALLDVSGVVDRLGDGANQAPTAALGASPTSGPAPLDVTFSLAATDADGVISSYVLDFDDGPAQSGAGLPPSASHTYAASGAYVATLTVTDNAGATGTASVTVNVGGLPATNPAVTGTLHAYYTAPGTGAGLDPWVMTGIALGVAGQDNVVPFYAPGQVVRLDARTVASSDPDVPVGLATTAEWLVFDPAGAIVAGPLATSAYDDANAVTGDPATGFQVGEFTVPATWAGRYYMGLRIQDDAGPVFVTDKLTAGLTPIDVVAPDGSNVPELPGEGDGEDEGHSIADADNDGQTPMGEIYWADVATDADSVTAVIQLGLVPPAPDGSSPTLYALTINGIEFESYLYGAGFGPRVYDQTHDAQVPTATTTWDRTTNRVTIDVPRSYLAGFELDCPCYGHVEAQAGPPFFGSSGGQLAVDVAPESGDVELRGASTAPQLPKNVLPGVAFGSSSDPENTDPEGDTGVQILTTIPPQNVPATWLDVTKVWVSREDAAEFDVTLKVKDLGASPGGQSPEVLGLAGVSWNYGAEFCLDNYAQTYTSTGNNYAGVSGVVCYRLTASNGLAGPSFGALSIQKDGSGGCAVSGLMKSGSFNVADSTVTWTLNRASATVATISDNVQSCTTAPPTRGTVGAVDGIRLSRLIGTSGYRVAAGASVTFPMDSMTPETARAYTFGGAADPLAVTLDALTGVVGTPINAAASITGGVAPYACSWTGVGATFSAPALCETTVTYASAGAYTLRVDVSDADGGSAFATANVAVAPASGERVELLVDGELSASVPVATSQAEPTESWTASVDLTGVPAGPVLLLARWIDADGAVLATASRQLTVGAPGAAYVRIDAPAEDARLTGTQTVSGIAGHQQGAAAATNAHGWPLASGETGLRAVTLTGSILSPCAACQPATSAESKPVEQLPDAAWNPIYNNIVEDNAESNLFSSSAWFFGPGSDSDGLDGYWFDVAGYAGASYELTEGFDVAVDLVFHDDALGTATLAWNAGDAMPKTGVVPAGANYAFAYVRKGTADTAANQWGATPSLSLAPQIVPPSVVQALTATPGPGAVALAWSAPAADGGELLGYNVYRDGAFLLSQSTTGYLDTPGDTATHVYEVAAYNGAGEGPRASVSSAALPNAPLFAITEPADGATGVGGATLLRGTYDPQGGSGGSGGGTFANTHYVYVLNLNSVCGDLLGYGDHVILKRITDHAVDVLGMPAANVHVYNENGGALTRGTDPENYDRLDTAWRTGAVFDGPANWEGATGVANEMRRIAALAADGEAAGGAPARIFFVESSHGILNPLILGDGMTDSSFCLQDTDVTSTMLGDLLNEIDASVASAHAGVAIEWSINVDCSFCGGFADSPLVAPGTTAIATAGVVGENRVVEVGCAWMTECTGNPATTYDYMFNRCMFTDQADGFGPLVVTGMEGTNGADAGDEVLVGSATHHEKDGVITLEEAYWCSIEEAHYSFDVFALEQEFQLVDNLDGDLFGIDGFVLWDTNENLGLGSKDPASTLGALDLSRPRASAADPSGDSPLPSGDLLAIDAIATQDDIVVELTVADLTTSSAQLEDVVEYDLVINGARYGVCYSLGAVYLYGYDIPNTGPTGEPDPGAPSAGSAVYDFAAGTILFTIPRIELPDQTLPAQVSGFSAATECSSLALPYTFDTIPDSGTVSTSAGGDPIEPGADRVLVQLAGPGGATVSGLATLDPETSTWAFDPAGDLADGAWTATATHEHAADGETFVAIATDTAAFSVGSGADTTPPSAPTGLAVSGEPTTTTVTLAWAAATDNVGVASYRVLRDGVLVGTTAGLAFTDTGLSPATTYTYTVAAEDAAGNVGPASAPALATTAQDAPGAGTVTIRAGNTILGSASVDTSVTDPATWQVSIDTTLLADGVHLLVAEYDDGEGSFVSDTVRVTVANVLAIDIASPVDGATVGKSFAVSGSTSGTDDVSSYGVEVRALGLFDWTPATYANGAFSHGVTNAVDGPLTVEARLLRDNSVAAVDSVTVNVVVPNAPPVASLVAAPTASEGTTALLDGSASHDDDGDALSYAWAQLAGPAVALDGAGATRTFTAPQVNVDTDLRFRLTVSDAEASSAAEVVVKILDLTQLSIDTVDGALALDGVEAQGLVTLAGRAHVANSGSGGNVNQPPQANVVYSTSGPSLIAAADGSFDPDGSIVSYAWTLTKGGVLVDTGAGNAYSYTATLSGTYVLALVVIDDRGAVGEAQTPAFSLIVPDAGGFVVDAGDSAFVERGDLIPLTATAFGAQGAVSYAWYVGGEVVATGQSVGIPSDAYSGAVAVTVSASDGARSDTDTVKVHVYDLGVASEQFEQDVLVAVNDEDPGQITDAGETSGAIDGETYAYQISVSASATKLDAFLTWENYAAIVPPNANNPLYPNGGGPSDFDLFAYGPDPAQDKSSADFDRPESLTIDAPAPGAWTMQVRSYLAADDRFTLWVNVTQAPPDPLPTATQVSGVCYATSPQTLVGAVSSGATGAWDADNDGTFETVGLTATTSYAVGSGLHFARFRADADGYVRTILVPFRVQSTCVGDPSMVVVAVSDTGLNVYSKEFEGKFVPDDVLRAFTTTNESQMGPGDVVRRDAAGNMLPFTRHPSSYIPGFPASAKPLNVTLGAYNQAADAAVWGSNTHQAVPLNTWFWVPGTKVVGVVDTTDVAPVNGQPDTVPILDEDGHGTASASVAVGNTVGSCPRCLLAFAEGLGGDVAFFGERWIDFVSVSGGSLANVGTPDGGLLGMEAATRAAAERGQTISYASGNGVENAFVTPEQTYTSNSLGPDWTIDVGAVVKGSGSATIGHGKPVDWVNFGAGAIAAACRNTYTATCGHSGTSSATPTATGHMANLLLLVREALGDSLAGQKTASQANGVRQAVAVGEPIATSAWLADGVLQRAEMWNAAFHCAVKTTSGSTGFPGALPATPVAYLYEGYGLANAVMESCARNVLLYGAAVPERAAEDQFFAIDHDVRVALWGDWDGDGDGARGGDYTTLNGGELAHAPALDVALASVGTLEGALDALRQAFAAAGLATSGVPVSETYFLHRDGCGAGQDNALYLDRSYRVGAEGGAGCAAPAATNLDATWTSRQPTLSAFSAAATVTADIAAFAFRPQPGVVMTATLLADGAPVGQGASAPVDSLGAGWFTGACERWTFAFPTTSAIAQGATLALRLTTTAGTQDVGVCYDGGPASSQFRVTGASSGGGATTPTATIGAPAQGATLTGASAAISGSATFPPQEATQKLYLRRDNCASLDTDVLYLSPVDAEDAGNGCALLAGAAAPAQNFVERYPLVESSLPLALTPGGTVKGKITIGTSGVDPARLEFKVLSSAGAIGTVVKEATAVGANGYATVEWAMPVPDGVAGQSLTALSLEIRILQQGAPLHWTELDNPASFIEIPRAADAIGSVEVAIDDATFGAASLLPVTGTESWTATWDLTSVAPGEHVIYARAIAGTSVGPADSVGVTVAGETGTTGAGRVDVAFTQGGAPAPDDWSPAAFAPASGEWSFDWDTSMLANGAWIAHARLLSESGATLQAESVVIQLVNERTPTLAPIADVVANENEAIAFTVRASDLDGQTLAYALDAPAAAGASLGSDTGAFEWTPTFAQAGLYQLTITVTDTTLRSASDTFQVTVLNVNRAPTLDAVPAASLAEGDSLAFALVGHDLDDDTLRYSVGGLPEGATVDELTGAFAWTPGFADAGAYEATFTVTDGYAAATRVAAFTVTNVNRAPVLSDVADRAVDENMPLVIDVAATDADGTPLAFAATGLPGATVESTGADTARVAWFADYDSAGVYALRITVSDGDGGDDAQDVVVTVTNVNRAPVVGGVPSGIVVDAGQTAAFTASVADADAEDAPTMTIENLPQGATLDGGAFSWRPLASQAGTHRVYVNATDGKAVVEKVVVILVRELPQMAVNARTGLPYATLAAALAESQAGDTLRLSPGTYPASRVALDDVTICAADGDACATSASEDVVILGELLVTGDRVTLQGLAFEASGAAYSNAVNADGAAGIRILDSVFGPTDIHTVHLWGSPGATVERNVFRNEHENVWAQAGSPDVVVRGNVFEGCVYCVRLEWGSDRALVEGNTFHLTASPAANTDPWALDLYGVGSVSRGNRFVAQTPGAGIGLVLDGVTGATSLGDTFEGLRVGVQVKDATGQRPASTGVVVRDAKFVATAFALDVTSTAAPIDARLNDWGVYAEPLLPLRVRQGDEPVRVLQVPFRLADGSQEPPAPKNTGDASHTDSSPAACGALDSDGDGFADAYHDGARCVYLTVGAALLGAHPGQTILVPASATTPPTARAEAITVALNSEGESLDGLTLCGTSASGDACDAAARDGVLIDGALRVVATGVTASGLTLRAAPAVVVEGEDAVLRDNDLRSQVTIEAGVPVDARGNDWGVYGRALIPTTFAAGTGDVAYVPYLDAQGAYHPPLVQAHCQERADGSTGSVFRNTREYLGIQDAVRLHDCPAPTPVVAIELAGDAEAYDGAVVDRSADIRGGADARILAPAFGEPAITTVAGSGRVFVGDVTIEVASGATGVVVDGLTEDDLTFLNEVTFLGTGGTGVLAEGGRAPSIGYSRFVGLNAAIKLVGTQQGLFYNNHVVDGAKSGAYAEASIVLQGAADARFWTNTIQTAVADQPIVAVYGEDAAAPELRGNVVRGNAAPGSIGIALRNVSGAVIDANLITGANLGVYLSNDRTPYSDQVSTDAIVRGNRIVAAPASASGGESIGISTYLGGGHRLEDNTVLGAAVGVNVLGATGVAVEGLVTSAATGVRVNADGLRGAQPTGISVRNSTLADATTALHVGSRSVALSVDAECNDWGVYNGAAIPARILDEGTLTQIDYTPFTSFDGSSIGCLPMPKAEFAATPTPAPKGRPVEFTDASTPGARPIVAWSWDFGDDATSVERNPTHAFAAYGTYLVSLRVTDLDGLTSSFVEAIDVLNRAPTLDVIESITVPEGALVQLQLAASDPDGDALTYAIADAPEGATLDPDTGAFSWRPAPAQAGLHVLTFSVSDGELSASQTASIDVRDVNHAPVLAPVGDRALDEGGVLALTLGATDADGDILTYSATGLPAGATLDGATGVLEWAPGFEAAGVYATTLSVTDGAAADTETIKITVRDVQRPPVLEPIGGRALVEGQTIDLLVRATDPEGDAIALGALGKPSGATFTDNGDGTGRFLWTPTYVQAGDWSVEFRAGDGRSIDAETVLVRVLDSQGGPQLVPIDDVTTSEGRSVTLFAQGIDPDGDMLTFGASKLPAGATFNGATRRFAWTPSYSQAGVHEVVLTVSDGKASASESFNVTVSNVNRAPAGPAQADVAAKANRTLAYKVPVTDPDGDALTFTAGGLPDGASMDGATGILSWRPDVGQEGRHTVAILATDGAATVSFTARIDVSANEVPTIAVVLPTAPQALAPATFQAVVADPDGTGAVTIEWDFDPDGAFVADAAGPNATRVYPDAGTYTLVAKATDADGMTTYAKATVVIDDVLVMAVDVPADSVGRDATAEGNVTLRWTNGTGVAGATVTLTIAYEAAGRTTTLRTLTVTTLADGTASFSIPKDTPLANLYGRHVVLGAVTVPTSLGDDPERATASDAYDVGL